MSSSDDDQALEELASAFEETVEPATGIVWQRLSEVEMRSIVFLDEPLLQADAFHLLAGRKGVGKGTYLANVAARVTRGELGDKRTVVWIGSEDSAAIDIRPRIEAAGGDPGLVVTVREGWIQLPRDLDVVEDKLTELGDVGLFVIDPIGNHIAGLKSNDEEIREAIGPLNKIADDHQCVVIAVRHLTEKECKAGALAAILGSSAWVQVPRVILGVVRDSDDPEIAHVQCIAGNRLPPGTSGRMYRIEGVRVADLDIDVTLAVAIGDSNKDVETLLATASDKQPSKSAAARERILDILETSADLSMESDALDARVAGEIGIASGTVRNLRSKMAKDGLIKNVPENNSDGTRKHWNVVRTFAPREMGNIQ